MRFTIPTDHPCLSGHFPGRPLVPGVVLLERVLEAIQATHGPLGPLRLPQVKFMQPLLPGEEARVELESAGAPAAASRWRFRVLRDATLLASGEVVATEMTINDGSGDRAAVGKAP
ncbi:MAG: hypothetical protein ACREPE_14480 [Lysobacter sp.]